MLYLIRNRGKVDSITKIFKLYLKFVSKPFTFIFVTCTSGRMFMCLPKSLECNNRLISLCICFANSAAIFFEGHKRAGELATYLFGESIISIWNNVKGEMKLEKHDKIFEQLFYAIAVAAGVSFFICGVDLPDAVLENYQF